MWKSAHSSKDMLALSGLVVRLAETMLLGRGPWFAMNAAPKIPSAYVVVE